jgi:hypothetical protein
MSEGPQPPLRAARGIVEYAIDGGLSVSVATPPPRREARRIGA